MRTSPGATEMVVAVGLGVSVSVGDAVAPGVCVAVGSRVSVGTGEAVSVAVTVSWGVLVSVGVRVGCGVGMGVSVAASGDVGVAVGDSAAWVGIAVSVGPGDGVAVRSAGGVSWTANAVPRVDEKESGMLNRPVRSAKTVTTLTITGPRRSSSGVMVSLSWNKPLKREKRGHLAWAGQSTGEDELLEAYDTQTSGDVKSLASRQGFLKAGWRCARSVLQTELLLIHPRH